MGDYGPALSRIHDEQFGAVARAGAAELIDRLHARGLMGGLVVDLGCGSGIAGRMLVDAGYDVLGVDASPAMLELARAAVPEAGFVAGSVYEVAIPSCVAVLALGEVFCYLPEQDRSAGGSRPELAPAHMEPSDLVALLWRVREALDPTGVLLFDVAGPGRGGPAHREQIREEPGWTLCVRHDRDDDRRRLVRRILAFTDDGSGAHRRDVETHTLRLLDPDEVGAALTRSGFGWSLLPGYGDFQLGPGWHAWACSPIGAGPRDEAGAKAADAGTALLAPEASSQFTVGRLDTRVPESGERFDLIAEWPDVGVEHIVSSASLDQQWQRQDHDEWVLLLDGEATLEVQGLRVDLVSGDWLLIPAQAPHRVCTAASGTQWLAVHVAPRAANAD